MPDDRQGQKKLAKIMNRVLASDILALHTHIRSESSCFPLTSRAAYSDDNRS